MSHALGKPSQTAARQPECSHPHRERVGIGRRGKEVSSRYCRVSAIKRRDSGIVILDGWWKLFYSGADPRMSVHAGMGILTNSQLADCVFDWISLGSRACMLKLKVKDRSLCLSCMPPML